MIKVKWLDACIALRLVDVDVKFAQSYSQWEAEADT